MKFASKWLSNIAAAFLVLSVAGCTYAPTPVHHNQPSFSDGVQNSGVISETAAGFIVDAHFYARWVHLCADYASLFPDAPKPADFVLQPDGTYAISNQSMTRFRVMTGLHDMGVAPKTK